MNRIQTAFNDIRAEDALKEKTLLFLRAEIGKRGKTAARIPVRRFAISIAFLLCVVFTGVLYNLHFTENAYIDFDINPSVELALNRFDRVIGVHAFNSDGEDILENQDIKHKNYKDAVSSLLDTLAQKGYLQNNELVSVTLQTVDISKESEMLSGLAIYVETNVNEHHGSVQIDVFPVSGDLRNNARELNLSPAKYLAIMELQVVDPTATVESCRDHTIGEIKSLTQEHEAGHHTEGDSGTDTQVPYTYDMPSHHGENTDNNAHGDGHD